jgi:hypothetical protein
VPSEISNAMLGRLPAVRATNNRERTYPPEVIEEFAAFLVLAVKHPKAVSQSGRFHIVLLWSVTLPYLADMKVNGL